MRRTKIVCTVGPSTDSSSKLRDIIQAGADVLRLNYSHETPEEHDARARNIRDVASELGKPVAILQDLPGPKIRLGTFRDGRIELKSGDLFTLTTKSVKGDQRRATVNYPKLAKEVRRGQAILLADGNVELRIESIEQNDIHCRVISGGALSNHKGVNVPRGALTISAFTSQDRKLLLSGLKTGVDMSALSFVRSSTDIASARRFLKGHKTNIPLMAKIEKPEAVDSIDDLISVVDAVMVARGDLGVEISAAEVPLVQKDIIAKSIRAATPVVTATQMLRSMVESPRPTRAEAADVANAVLDGTDAVMLSEETAVGAFPVEAVKTLARIAERAESRLFVQPHSTTVPSPAADSVSEAIGYAACLLAYSSGAHAVICCTKTGRTAQLVAKHRSQIPIIAVSPNPSIVRRLMLTWGVFPILSDEFVSTGSMVSMALNLARDSGMVSRGDRVVVTGGAADAEPGQTDFLRVASIP